jgi:hypothetical protein
MQASNAPTKVPLPFANAGAKNTIPTASQIGVTPGAASLTDGFPPLTRTPIAAGGVPPSGQDMNGILNLISANTMWENAGGFYPYDATFSTAIGGYPKGAILAKATNNGLWLSTVDNNVTNPDTGGAGWSDPLAGRVLRTSVYTLVGGVQMVSIDGGAFGSTGATTFTALSSTSSVEIEIGGGGGGAGGASATTSTQVSFGSGASSGAYGRGKFFSGFASLAITAGTAGTGAPAGNNSGTAGGTSSAGALMTAPGGAAGVGGGAVGVSSTTPGSFNNPPGQSAPATGGYLNARGPVGFAGLYAGGVSNPQGGAGGSHPLGTGGNAVAGSNGANATGYSAGGSGGAQQQSQSGATGGAGAPGVVIIRELA